MASIDPRIFRAYDIRGKALTQLTEEAVELIAHAFALELKKIYRIDHPKVLLGRDMRLSSPVLEQAALKGLTSAGCHVLTMGQTPSPLNYFTVCTQHLDGSMQITASHNPKDDNGIKLQVRDAEAFAGDDIQRLRESVEMANGQWAMGNGSVEEIDAVTPYINHLTKLFGDSGKRLSVVVDSGNGVAGPVYCKVLRNVGCEVTELYTEPDGTFPNHPADPSKWETLKDLQDLIVSRRFQSPVDIGIAFDGDGDRLGVVDETGAIRSSDDVILLLAQDHLERNLGAPVVFTVSNSSVLEEEILKWGGKPIMTKVGHSFVEHEMRHQHSQLGGEQSGHFFCFEDYFSFDDALVAALRVIKILGNQKLKIKNQNISSLMEAFPKVFLAPERRPHCPDDAKGTIIASVIAHFSKSHPVNTLDGARIDFGEGAWAGIRQSNTSPCISICIEARSTEKLKFVEGVVLSHLKNYPEILI